MYDMAQPDCPACSEPDLELHQDWDLHSTDFYFECEYCGARFEVETDADWQGPPEGGFPGMVATNTPGARIPGYPKPEYPESPEDIAAQM